MNQRIVLGLWPIAGVTTVGVTTEDARATIAAAIDGGIHQFDTAFSYGYDGESDRLLGEFLQGRRDEFEVIGKVGQRWTKDRKRIVDGSQSQLIADAEESLRRMKTEYFDILFLHSPDPEVPLCESAHAMESLCERGLCRRIGLSNMTIRQLGEFSESVDCHAVQCPLNMIQRDNQSTIIDSCQKAGRSVFVYWTLMKGLLAGKISRDHVFAPGDSRPGYPIFQGALRETIHDAMDQLQLIGREVDQTMPQLAVGWALSQPGVTAALVGARRPDQIQETLGANALSADLQTRINEIVQPAVDLARDQ